MLTGKREPHAIYPTIGGMSTPFQTTTYGRPVLYPQRKKSDQSVSLPFVVYATAAAVCAGCLMHHEGIVDDTALPTLDATLATLGIARVTAIAENDCSCVAAVLAAALLVPALV